MDQATIYWDELKQAIVIVKDGKIVTFFKPDEEDPRDYYDRECLRTGW